MHGEHARASARRVRLRARAVVAPRGVRRGRSARFDEISTREHLSDHGSLVLCVMRFFVSGREESTMIIKECISCVQNNAMSTCGNAMQTNGRLPRPGDAAVVKCSCPVCSNTHRTCRRRRRGRTSTIRRRRRRRDTRRCPLHESRRIPLCPRRRVSGLAYTKHDSCGVRRGGGE